MLPLNVTISLHVSKITVPRLMVRVELALYSSKDEA